MKVLCAIKLFLLSFLTAAVEVAHACSCFPTSMEDSLYSDNVHTVFRGYVQRMVTFNDTTSLQQDIVMFNPQPNYYIVNVQRVYKGCAFQNATTILIETESQSSLCGVSFGLKKSYIFSGTMIPAKPNVTEKIAPKNPNILRTAMVRTNLCLYRTEFKSLTTSEKTLLGETTNMCTKCDSAADCPGGIDDGKYYCDKGKCVAFDRPCPPIQDLPWLKDYYTNCAAVQCSTTTPCANATCLVNKCDPCTSPLWIDAKGSRVCQI
jgi:hypothetical protein